MMYTTVASVKNHLDKMILADMVNEGRTVTLNNPADADTILALPRSIEIIEAVITSASMYIDSFLLGYMDMTLTATQEAMDHRCVLLSVYFLYQRQGKPDTENPYYRIYQNTEKWLSDMAKGHKHSQADPQDGPEQVEFDSGDDALFTTGDGGTLEGF